MGKTNVRVIYLGKYIKSDFESEDFDYKYSPAYKFWDIMSDLTQYLFDELYGEDSYE